jgi:hypothetical protein
MEQIKKREQQLFNLGFSKSDHQKCFCKYEWEYGWYFDFFKIEKLENDVWNKEIEKFKQELKEFKNCIKRHELYLLGFNSAQKELKQKITDSLKNYKSKLKEETYPKLTKTINKDKVRDLEIRIETLNKLL